jgi:hypothetical protein
MVRIQESPDHAVEAPKLESFYEQIAAQEKFLVDAGLPASGSSDFLTRWFTAWFNRDTDGIIDCVAADVEFVDPGTGGLLRGNDALRDYTDRFFIAVPDLRFYPQDGANVLPYWDFFGERARITVPWRAIGRFTGTLSLEEWPTLAPTSRNMNCVGIDRYVFNDGFEIARIDTDYDMVGVLQQFGLLPNLQHPTIRAAALVERAVAPLLRATARK